MNEAYFKWGENETCEGWWLKSSGYFVVVEEKMPPGTFEELHYHEKTEQFFYVLEGELKIDYDHKYCFLKSGEGITIKPKSIHQVRNVSAFDVRFLVISSSNPRDDRINV